MNYIQSSRWAKNTQWLNTKNVKQRRVKEKLLFSIFYYVKLLNVDVYSRGVLSKHGSNKWRWWNAHIIKRYYFRTYLKKAGRKLFKRLSQVEETDVLRWLSHSSFLHTPTTAINITFDDISSTSSFHLNPIWLLDFRRYKYLNLKLN